MITLYLILLAIIGLGIAALVLIVSGYVKHSRQTALATTAKAAKPKSMLTNKSKLMATVPPVTDPVLAELGFSALDTVTPDLAVEPIVATTPARPAPIRQTAPARKEIIAFYLLAPAKQPFMGYELLQAMLATGLRYGEMSIFHRYEQQLNTDKSVILFSLASAVEPGIFDMANIGSISCPGLSIFMAPASVENPVAAFDLMVETAQQLADDLGGLLCNEQREPLNPDMIKKYRAALL